MDYVEWVEKVLQGIAEAWKQLDADQQEYTGFHFTKVGVALGFDEAEMWISGEEKPSDAVLKPIYDLQHLGILKQGNLNGTYRLTQRGRQIVQAGLSAIWPSLIGQYLEPEQLEVLTKLVEVGQKDQGTYVSLVGHRIQDIGAMLGSEWSTGRSSRIFTVLKQLEDLGWAHIGGAIGAYDTYPTYAGIVRVTRTMETKLHALIRDLLADGENVNVDFKQEVHLQTKAQKGEFIKDLLALVTTKARGERYMLIGFDDKTGAFVKSVDPSITKDRIEDLLIAYTESVPSVRYDTTTWEGGTVGLIEVIREAHKLPYRVKVDIGDKLKAGDVFVRHGSHTAKLKPGDEEYLDLVAEGDRARLT